MKDEEKNRGTQRSTYGSCDTNIKALSYVALAHCIEFLWIWLCFCNKNIGVQQNSRRFSSWWSTSTCSTFSYLLTSMAAPGRSILPCPLPLDKVWSGDSIHYHKKKSSTVLTGNSNSSYD